MLQIPARHLEVSALSIAEQRVRVPVSDAEWDQLDQRQRDEIILGDLLQEAFPGKLAAFVDRRRRDTKELVRTVFAAAKDHAEHNADMRKLQEVLTPRLLKNLRREWVSDGSAELLGGITTVGEGEADDAEGDPNA